MKRHPSFVDRNDILGSRGRTANSPAREEVPERQCTPERRRVELVKNATYAKRTCDRPAGTRRPSTDDRMEIQKVDCDGLNCLRGVAPVMLHAIRVTPERFDRWCIAASWDGRSVLGNPRLREQLSNVGPPAHNRPTKQSPTSSGCADVSMRRSVVRWKQGTATRARR